MSHVLDSSALLEALLPVVRHAGAAIMQIYATDFAVRAIFPVRFRSRRKF